MPTTEKKVTTDQAPGQEAAGTESADAGMFGRLAGRGDEALKRFSEEIDKNARMRDGLDRLLDAAGRLEQAGRPVLARLGIASVEEVDALRKEVAKLEERLSELEGAKKGAGAPSV